MKSRFIHKRSLVLLLPTLVVLLSGCGSGSQPKDTFIQLPEVEFTPGPTLKSREAEIAARDTLSAALGITEQALTVYRTESLDWFDASLGCPKTGYSYAQVITPGYKITFDVDGVHYEVHTDLDGSRTVLCNAPTTIGYNGRRDSMGAGD